MMEFACPTCGGMMRAPEAYAGKRGRCKRCGAISVAPRAAGEPAIAVAAEQGPKAAGGHAADPVPTPVAAAPTAAPIAAPAGKPAAPLAGGAKAAVVPRPPKRRSRGWATVVVGLLAVALAGGGLYWFVFRDILFPPKSAAALRQEMQRKYAAAARPLAGELRDLIKPPDARSMDGGAFRARVARLRPLLAPIANPPDDECLRVAHAASQACVEFEKAIALWEAEDPPVKGRSSQGLFAAASTHGQDFLNALKLIDK